MGGLCNVYNKGVLMKIYIIDYGMGNLKSILNALKHVTDYEVAVTDDPKMIPEADAYILPGVGAFRDAIKNLRDKEFVEILNKEVLENKKPILGICLGMQLLFTSSNEGGYFEGLNWIDGEIKFLNPGNDLRVPHVGWNDLIIKDEAMFSGLGSDKNTYFVHSYFADTDEKYITSTFDYGKEYTASVCKSNIWGMQFHPEKSQKNGFQLLRNYISFCERSMKC